MFWHLLASPFILTHGQPAAFLAFAAIVWRHASRAMQARTCWESGVMSYELGLPTDFVVTEEHPTTFIMAN